MNKTERMLKTEEYISNELKVITSFKTRTIKDYEYRLQHSFRVANICVDIASKENIDIEKAYIAGLLHDLGYVIDYDGLNLNFKDHGRDGARLARPFLIELGFSDEEVNEMCFGIAIHVDDKADFDGDRTPLALIIGDADNIDRYDTYRIYENLYNEDFANMTIEKQEEHVDKYLNGLQRLLNIEFATKTSQKMWKHNIEFYLEFYKKLKKQINISK